MTCLPDTVRQNSKLISIFAELSAKKHGIMQTVERMAEPEMREAMQRPDAGTIPKGASKTVKGTVIYHSPVGDIQLDWEDGAVTALKNAGVEAYALEARLLVAYAVGKTKEEFVRDLRLYTSDENEQKIEALLQRRIAGEPLAYLIGEWEFHGLPIVVTPDVLIPRMDTEVLVDAALRVLVGRKMNARILDLCSGSGCIGCALAHELPAARVVMVDISDEALTVSKENLRRNHQNRTICLKADALEKPPMGIGTFDLIVSNPPYVASMDILTLDSSVRDYEPLGALDGGEDGLMFYRAIVRHWTQILRPGGWLMFEVGEDQADTVMALMTEEKYTDVTALEDTAGIRRVVVGRI